MLLKYFNISNFDSPDIKGSGSRMQPSTLLALDKAREIAGIPFYVNSGYRSPAHNKRVGGVKDSSHLRGWAVDVRARSEEEKYKIIRAATMAGFHRIGVYKTFIHMDNDPTKKARIWIR